MNIALTADPELPVPPRHYGGIERIIDMLAHGLVARGHNVTLFAHPESNSSGQLIAWPGRSSMSRKDTLRNAYTLARHASVGKFDLVHSFSRLAYLAPILPMRFPKLMSYQREVSVRTSRLAYRLSRGTLDFTAISHWMVEPVRRVGRWHVIPNGVCTDKYTFQSDVAPNAPLVFLGRIEEIKGPHLAIDIAKRTGKRLVIAGNIPEEKRQWAEQYVLPHIDGAQIRYVGPVDDRQKNDLLGGAAALLMPILWEEPFGIVMIEALACGAPVIGFARGAVPEVIVDGVTGFVCDDVDGLTSAVGRLFEIERAACRRRVNELYSHDVVVDAYVSLYRERLRALGQV